MFGCRCLLKLQDVTGYEIVQKQGQRIFGSPPPGWVGPPPNRGTEIYCYRIPRDCYEDELVPVFAAVGRLYELRLMIEFSGANRLLNKPPTPLAPPIKHCCYHCIVATTAFLTI